MKGTIITGISVLLLAITGCSPKVGRYITEKYIKTRLENHQVGELSAMKTYALYKGYDYQGAYLELTGYKEGTSKGMAIGWSGDPESKQYQRKELPRRDSIRYTALDLTQCKALIRNYELIENKIEAARPKRNEEIYQDYTVSKDLFISFKKARHHRAVTIDLWVKGNKFSMPASQFIKEFKAFMSA